MITGPRDLKHEYMLLFFCSQYEGENAQGAIKKYIKEIKIGIRSYLKQEEEKRKRNGNRRIIHYCSDDYIVRIECPDWVKDKEDAEYWFEDEFIPSPNSPYDCTRQQFTAWYKFFKVDGKYICYHCIAIDV